MRKVKNLSIVIEPEVKEQLVAFAKAKKMTLAQVIRDALVSHLASEPSVGLPSEARKRLTQYAKSKQITVTQAVQGLVERFLPTEGHVPVLIKIPSQYIGDRQSLEQWMELKSAAVVSALEKC